MHTNDRLNLFNLPKTMKAIVLGEPDEQFKLTETALDLPICTDNEILIKVEYVGLNPLDVQFAKAGFCKWQYPHILGLDAVGTVVQAKKGQCPGVGDRVMWHASLGDQGVLSTYAKVPNFAATLVPENIPSDIAVTVPCAGLSARIALEKIKISEGDSVFIERGAGSVGQFAIQLAKLNGATVFTTASKHNHKFLKKLGADEVFDYHDDKLYDKMSKVLGHQGFDAVIDSIGGDNTVKNIELMKFCGRIACLKSLPILPPELLFRKAPNISIVSLGGAWLAKSLCAQQRMSFMNNALLESITNKKITTPETTLVNFDAEHITRALHNEVALGSAKKHIVHICDA